MARLMKDLAGVQQVFIDTPAFIYFVEEHPRYIETVEPLFIAIDRGNVGAVTSALTLLETLVVPLRHKKTALAQQYEQLLTNSQNLTLLELNLDIIKRAAGLRATKNLKTPDALQLAAGLHAGCAAFVTNDRDLPKISAIRVFQLDNYI